MELDKGNPMIRSFTFSLLCLLISVASAHAVTFSASGTVYKTQDGNYSTAWSAPNSYVNNSGGPMVVQNLDVMIEARDGLGLSYFDLCAVIMEDGDYKTVNDVEVVCVGVDKIEAVRNFNQTRFQITFPGQGVYLPTGKFFHFNIQGFAETGALQEAADASFSSTIMAADTNGTDLPVQALRAPYIDRFFTGTYSGLTPHTNTTNQVRPVLGEWTYISVKTNSTTSLIRRCLGTRDRDSLMWGSQCTNFNPYGTFYPGPVTIQNPGYVFRPGDKIGADCTLLGDPDSLRRICASYFYVSVPKENGVFLPLGRNETILTVDSKEFCDATSGFSITDDAIDSSVCKTLLDPTMTAGTRIAFGGMFGYGHNGTPQTYTNMVTSQASCPVGYEKSQLLGATSLDYPIFYCYQVLEANETQVYDFGGVFGYGNPSHFPNPFTSAFSCPPGYSSHKVLGTVGLDYDFRYCIRSHVSGGANFYGLYGFGYDGSAVNYSNPRTGKNQCPSGSTATTVFGTSGLDYPIVVCH